MPIVLHILLFWYIRTVWMLVIQISKFLLKDHYTFSWMEWRSYTYLMRKNLNGIWHLIVGIFCHKSTKVDVTQQKRVKSVGLLSPLLLSAHLLKYMKENLSWHFFCIIISLKAVLLTFLRNIFLRLTEIFWSFTM